jgi:transcriptional regulator with XRE-family HTH domain
MNEGDLYRSVGQAIALRRRELKRTQDEIAATVGLSRASLANIETGRQKILLHYLYRLAIALELPGIEALLPAQTVIPTTVPVPQLPIKGEELSRKQEAEVLAFVANSSTRKRRRGDKNA